MTYFGFLIVFLLIPITVLMAVVLLDRRKGVGRSNSAGLKPAGSTFILLVIIAVTYTTLWDNYLVATQVWWYDPARVFGITFGWVPLEEYLFFILQPILVGLWIYLLIPRVSNPRPVNVTTANIRVYSLISTVSLWIFSLLLLFVGGGAENYLGLEIAWALPAIIFQLAFGADILWRQRSLIFWSIVIPTIYLSLADALAIGTGIWTINPAKSTGIIIAGVLPLEEFIFFLLTNTLVVFGFVLFWSPESFARWKGIWSKFRFRTQEVTLQKE